VVQELSQLLEEPSYREHAKRVARQVEEENGTNRACDAIEQVLRQ
jgi:UDP:flavonoid glycosyltransferase YjiC (YdhE family)